MRVFKEKHNETPQPKSSILNRTNALKSHDVNLRPENSAPVTGNSPSWNFSSIGIVAPRDGARLIGHELGHVVQQRASQPTIQRQPAPNDPFAPGGTYEQLQILRGSGTLESYEYNAIPRPKDGTPKENTEKWNYEVQIRRAKKFSAALARLGELKDQRAVRLLIEIVEDKIIGPNDFTPEQILALKDEALTTLAKIGGSVALWKLHELLNSNDPNERMKAARAYSAASGRVAVVDLRIALMQETDETLKIQIISALGNVSGLDAKTKQTIVTELLSIVEHEPLNIKRAAITALGRLQVKTATEPLIKELKDHHSIPELAGDIEWALGDIGDDRAVDILVIMLEKHGSPSVRSGAARALGQIGGDKAHAALKRQLKQEPDKGVRTTIARALAPPILHWEFKSAESQE